MKKICVSKLHAALLFARHGVAGEKAFISRLAKDGTRSCDNFRLRTTHIGKQGFGRKRPAQHVDEINDCTYGSGKHHDLAAAHGVPGIRVTLINRSLFPGALQVDSAIATHDLSRKATCLQRQSERATNQTGTDNRDLTD